MLDGQPNHSWQLCSPLELHTGGSDFRLYDGSHLKTYLLMGWLLSGPPGFTCWISFAPVFGFMKCWFLIFTLSPFYILTYMILEIMHR